MRTIHSAQVRRNSSPTSEATSQSKMNTWVENHSPATQVINDGSYLLIGAGVDRKYFTSDDTLRR